MNSCGAARVLVPGFLVGMVVASLAGSDLIGWIAAAVTMAVFVAVGRIRGTGSACELQLPVEPAHEPEVHGSGSDR